MIKLKTKKITVLTESQISQVAGGGATDGENEDQTTPTRILCEVSMFDCESNGCVTFGCDGSEICVSGICESNQCFSDICESHGCASVICDSYNCASVGCNSYGECNSDMCGPTIPCETYGC